MMNTIRPRNALGINPEDILRTYDSQHRFMKDWLLNQLTEDQKSVIRKGALGSEWSILLESIDTPGAREDFLLLLDIAQCLQPRNVEPTTLELDRIKYSAEVLHRLFKQIPLWLKKHHRQVHNWSKDTAEQLWQHLVGPQTRAKYSQLVTRLNRLRETAPENFSAVEECVLSDYPELFVSSIEEDELCGLSPTAFIRRRLRSWIRHHTTPIDQDRCYLPSFAQWDKQDYDFVFHLLIGPDTTLRESSVTLPSQIIEPRTDPRRILVVSHSMQESRALRDLASHVSLPYVDYPQGSNTIEEIPPMWSEISKPCVLYVVEPHEDAEYGFRRIRNFLEQPYIILLLNEDNPDQALRLRKLGAFDVFYRKLYDRDRLLKSIEHAVNGGEQPPYGALIKISPEYILDSTYHSWALLYREPGSGGRLDEADYNTIQRLPRHLELAHANLTLLEVPLSDLQLGTPLPDFVFALLSSNSESEAKRNEFLKSFRQLEGMRKRVLYLIRSGAALPLDLDKFFNHSYYGNQHNVVRYYSSIELLLRLYFGFNGLNPRDPLF